MASHDMVAHRWAQMNNKLSISGHHMWADGFSIFSYGRHFEIARWVPTLASERKRVKQGVPAMCVLFNENRSYSVSTAKHCTITRRAIRGSAWVFTLPTMLWHAPREALKYYYAAALEQYQKAGRARVYAEYHRSEAERILNEAQNYALAFNVNFKRPDFAELQRIAERQIAKARQAEKKAAAERVKREAVELARYHLQFVEWQSGEDVRCPYVFSSDKNGNAYVRRYRVNRSEAAKDELQTSQGASVPWEHAVKAFRFIKLCRERGEAWSRNGHSIRVGHFQIDHIDAEGNMRAGCHRFAWDAMNALAIAQGVAGFAASSEAVETKT